MTCPPKTGPFERRLCSIDVHANEENMREGAWCPIAANQRWSLDFTMDERTGHDAEKEIAKNLANE